MTPFQHICESILFLDTNDMRTLKTQRIRSIRSLGKISPAALTSMNFVDTITNTLLEIQAYIVYHDFKIDDATWLAFNEDLWAQLPHATYSPIVFQLPTPIVIAPGPSLPHPDPSQL